MPAVGLGTAPLVHAVTLVKVLEGPNVVGMQVPAEFEPAHEVTLV